MRDKTNFAKITSRWLNIVGIHGRSRVSNGTQDFDLAMRSTKVDRFANYGFQHASRTSNLSSSKTLRNNCGLCRVFLTWLMKWCVPRACNIPRHSPESDYMGFLGRKKNSWGGLRSTMSRRLYFGLSRKISNLSNMIRSMIRDPNRDQIFDPIRDPIWSDPVRSGPIQILSTPQTQGLGHFRNHSRSF